MFTSAPMNLLFTSWKLHPKDGLPSHSMRCCCCCVLFAIVLRTSPVFFRCVAVVLREACCSLSFCGHHLYPVATLLYCFVMLVVRCPLADIVSSLPLKDVARLPLPRLNVLLVGSRSTGTTKTLCVPHPYPVRRAGEKSCLQKN